MTVVPVTLESLAADLAQNVTTSRQLVEDCLDRIADPSGEGARVFLKVHGEAARAAADYHDRLRAAGAAASPYAGIPVSVKDLFDIAGETTTAGSRVLHGAPPAARDAVAVARLRAAGFVVIGRTNMTEFAYSGLGVNPHYDTPRNPWRRHLGTIPGGSSSGAAVSVADGMAFAGLGTDTGGSCRIPAAMCGIAGFKPTARRVPLTGAYPLSFSLDSVGPLAASARCCAILDAVLSGSADAPQVPTMELRGRTFAVPQTLVLDNMTAPVAAAFDRALRTLSQAGAAVREIELPQLAELGTINHLGGLAAAEAYAEHRTRMAHQAAQYDPRVISRISRGAEQTAADYIHLLRQRASFIDRAGAELTPFDAVLMPTVPMLPPTLDDLAGDDDYVHINTLALRNSSVVNFLDGCAVSVPCHEPGEGPVGLTLFSIGGRDRAVLTLAAAVETRLGV